MSINRFNWRPWASAPRDNDEPVVCLRVVRHVGGWARPIDLAIELCPLMHRGYWHNERRSIGDPDLKHCHWTTPEEFATAVPADEWRKAPKDYFGVGPVVFVRPVTPRYPEWTSTLIYAADVVWIKGVPPPGPDPWHSVHAVNTPIAHGYLDGENASALPFRWCRLAEFFPQATFDAEIEMAENMLRYQRQTIERWRSLPDTDPAPPPTIQ